MTQEITRSFDIDVGHRLMNHEGKCRNAHGHRYTVEVTCRALHSLDSNGRVIDFGVIKSVVGEWLDTVFDHGFVFEKGDPIGTFLETSGNKAVELDVPPSIENLTRIWFEGAAELLAPHGIVVTRVRGDETARCWAVYTSADARIDRAGSRSPLAALAKLARAQRGEDDDSHE